MTTGRELSVFSRHSRGLLIGNLKTLKYQSNATTKIPVRFSNPNDDFSKWNPGATNLSGTNLNVGIYDNDLKGVGQDARSNWTPVQAYERAKLCVPLLFPLGSALHKDVLSEPVR